MKQHEENSIGAEAKEMSAEFPDMGTPANPLDEQWESLGVEQDSLQMESD